MRDHIRKPLVIGNWKMHGSLAENRDLLEFLAEHLNSSTPVSVAVCPPYPYLATVNTQLANSAIQLGAQNLCASESGAYTGEVSGAMLHDIGCQYVLVGHSERRSLYGETDADVAAKFEAVSRADMVPVLCVGETLEERETGLTEGVVSKQIDAVLDRVGIQGFSNAVVAYEPIWAIGTGLTASSQQVQEVHAMIRQKLAELDADIAIELQILYGGSVKADNASALFSQPDVDGGLVGGASLDAEAFVQICLAAE